MKRPNRKPPEPGTPAGGKARARSTQDALARGLVPATPAGTRAAGTPAKRAKPAAPRATPVRRKP